MKIYAGQSHFINEQEESTLCAESPKSLWALHLRDSRAKDGHHQANRAGSDSHCRHLWVLIFLFSVRHHGGLVKGVRAIRILPSQSLRAGVVSDGCFLLLFALLAHLIQISCHGSRVGCAVLRPICRLY
ncbi:hypothetical protein PGTUg99_036348 [Puccinia graminis f. sp. tritici]|uniref:Uncharacterized protein n=1 Tax=Puccinia graminis f. sp. tritici TaxID=56615 RepID=A0A5B0SER3_PUCGR|nr:hypothetical protein PGTUg99_036348 [Puccinia graminis f. sp. tritici]